MRNGVSFFCCVCAALLGGTVAGCGSADSSARPDIAAIPDEVHFGKDVKAQLYTFRAKVRKRGAEAAKQDLPDLLESVASYEKRQITKDKDVYQQIVEKLKALQTKLTASASREDAIKAAEEVGSLADKLPGETNVNPVVE